jgi:hypothetical protein
MTRAVTILLAALASGSVAAGQESNIATGHRFSWEENCGWMNWRDAGDPTASHGVQVHAGYLEGMIWLENAGWLNMGDGTPGYYADCNVDGLLTVSDFGCFETRFIARDRYADCTGDGLRNAADFACFQTAFLDQRPAGAYSNAVGSDAGVNVLSDGALEGFAWGENIGWVNLGTADLGKMRARFDPVSRRFRGYAWGENVGWVNLDHKDHYVATACYADCDDNQVLTVADFGCFQTRFAAADPEADCNADGRLTVADFGCFQTEFVAGCILDP